jgi:hypothetical protein
MEPVDGAPCFFSGLLTLGGCGLPTTDTLADCFVTGNGKIQAGVMPRCNRRIYTTDATDDEAAR